MRPSRRASVLITGLLALALLLLGSPAEAATKRTATVAPSAGTVAPGAGVVFSGRVTKTPKKYPVTLQRLDGGTWVAVASGKTVGGGAFSLIAANPGYGAYSYRVFAPKKGGRKAATSGVVTVTSPAPAPAPPSGGGPSDPPPDPTGDGTTTNPGVSGNSSSSHAAVSRDGRYVAFVSSSSDLLSTAVSAGNRVYRFDTHTGRTVLVSPTLDGQSLSGGAPSLSISDDGNFIAFDTSSSNVVSGDGNNDADIFRYDVAGHAMTRVTTYATGAALEPSMSANGTRIAYSWEPNLADGTPRNIFVATLSSGTWTAQVATKTDGTHTEGQTRPSIDPALSADGKYVAYQSDRPLVSGDGNGTSDIYKYDIAAQSTVLLSRANGTTASANASSGTPSISDDGRFVAYQSHASNLIGSDLNGSSDIFVADTQPGVTTTRASIGTSGEISDGAGSGAISGDGTTVVFQSASRDVTTDDSSSNTDVFRRVLSGTTERVSVPSGATSDESAVSANGRYVVFGSTATNLVASDANGDTKDVFRRDMTASKTILVSRKDNT